uniref:Uncharacterized protein n=1 Tax=Arundo donax TaxID=35708 RepID=A0A0A9BM03_ARUDO
MLSSGPVPFGLSTSLIIRLLLRRPPPPRCRGHLMRATSMPRPSRIASTTTGATSASASSTSTSSTTAAAVDKPPSSRPTDEAIVLSDRFSCCSGISSPVEPSIIKL